MCLRLDLAVQVQSHLQTVITDSVLLGKTLLLQLFAKYTLQVNKWVPMNLFNKLEVFAID